jgi:ribose-phosphate pyrophosphokinase
MKRLTINIPGDRGKLYEVIHYPAGEIQTRLTPEGIRACADKEEYVIVANPIPDIIELAQLKDALDAESTVFYRKLELPYLPYARADRRFVKGDSFGLAVFARLINSLHFDTVTTFDVHSACAEVHINNLLNLDPIHHYDQLTDCIKYLGGPNGVVLIAPDKGAKRRYDLESYGLQVLEGEKVRDPKTGKLSGFKIDKRVAEYPSGLIVDDICDGGGTFIGLGQEIRKLNPKMNLGLYVSHGIFSQGTEKLYEIFNAVFISDFSFIGNYPFKKI